MNKNEIQHYGVLGMRWGVRRALRSVPESHVARKGGREVVVTDYGTAGKHVNANPTKRQLAEARSPIRSQLQNYIRDKQALGEKMQKAEAEILNRTDAELKRKMSEIDKMDLGPVSKFLTKMKAEHQTYRSQDQEVAVALGRIMDEHAQTKKANKQKMRSEIADAARRSEALWQSKLAAAKSLPFSQKLKAYLDADREVSKSYVADLYAIEERYK